LRVAEAEVFKSAGEGIVDFGMGEKDAVASRHSQATVDLFVANCDSEKLLALLVGG